MAIVAACPMFKRHSNGKVIFIKNNQEFFRRTVEETVISASKEVSKSKIKKHAKKIKQYLRLHS